MSKEPWKCPYYECKQECPRNWNLKRHIKRFHNGIGVPVKHTLKANNAHLQPAVQQRPANETFREEQDPIDMVYEAFKKQKDRIEKMKEIGNFLYGHSSLPIYPVHPMAQNIGPLPFGGTNYINNSNGIGTFDLPVGFKTHICIFCLTGPIDPVSSSEFNRVGPVAFNSRHTRKQEDIQRIQSVAEQYDIIDKWDELRLLSLHRLVEIVHLWVGPHRDVYLTSFEVSKPQIEYSTPISLGRLSKNHWACRALDYEENKKTVIDDTELLYFLNRAKATLGLFQAEIDGKARYFYSYIIGGGEQALV